MIRSAFSLVALIPAAALAQAAGASGQAQAKTEVHAGKVEAATTVDAEIAAARARGLPERPIAKRVAEGRAKGAADAQIAASARQLRLNMESAAEVMGKAGRTASGDEIERGAYAMERGYSRIELESVVKSAPPDRSLVVALDVLARLQDRGMGTAQALAQVQSKLLAKADDAALESLANANAGVNAVTAPAAIDGKAAVGAAAGVAGAAAGTATKATGIVKKP